MESDLSHEALTRFEAIEARLDALEGGGTPEAEEEEVEYETEEEA